MKRRSHTPDSAAAANDRLVTPPAPTLVEMAINGKVAFTPEENQFVLDYARVLFHRDPHMGMHALSTRVAKKVRSISSQSLVV